MEMNIRTFSIPTGNGPAPVLMYEPERSVCAGTVLLYHGLGAAKEVQRKELEWLCSANLRGVCVDAPHHGERSDGLLNLLASAENPHPEFIRIVREAAFEIPTIVDYCIDRFGGKVAVCGISLGGFIAFAAVPIDKRLAASVPILGSPDWNQRDGRAPSKLLLELMEHSPVKHPASFPPCALLVANAGKDAQVPPQAARDFVKSLRPHYRDCADRLQYLEYPESEHMMREQDWISLWQKTTAWLLRFLT